MGVAATLSELSEWTLRYFTLPMCEQNPCTYNLKFFYFLLHHQIDLSRVT